MSAAATPRARSVFDLAPMLVALGVTFGATPLGPKAAEAQPAAARAGAGQVTVSVWDEGQPAEGSPIVFHDAGGAVLSEARSGKDGKATAELPPNAMVTVVIGDSLKQLYTVVGVQPGDEIVVGEAVDEEGIATVVGSAAVRLPGKAPGAARYGVSLGVGMTDAADPAAPVAMPVFSRFIVEERRFQVLAEALDRSGEPIGYAFAWAPWDGSKTRAQAKAAVALPPWRADYAAFEVAVANAPDGAAVIRGGLSIEAKDEDRFERPAREAELRGGAATLRFRAPRELGREAKVRLELGYPASPDRAVIVRREEALAARTAIDLGATLLPRVSSARVSRDERGARPAVEWDVSGDVSRADAVIARVAWPETREHVWTIVSAAKGPTRARLPELPPALAAWRPDAASRMSAAVAIVEASFYDGFADVRRKGIQLLTEPPEDAEGALALTYSATGEIDF